MVTVTVSMFGDKELEVEASEVDVLRGQGILTSVDGVAEEDATTEAAAGVIPAAELKSAGEPAKEAKASGSQTPDKPAT